MCSTKAIDIWTRGQPAYIFLIMFTSKKIVSHSVTILMHRSWLYRIILAKSRSVRSLESIARMKNNQLRTQRFTWKTPMRRKNTEKRWGRDFTLREFMITRSLSYAFLSKVLITRSKKVDHWPISLSLSNIEYWALIDIVTHWTSPLYTLGIYIGWGLAIGQCRMRHLL